MSCISGLKYETVLSSGRASVRWQEKIVQGTERLGDLHRSSAWIEALEATVNLTLYHGPLLGFTFTELAEQLTREPERPGVNRHQAKGAIGKTAEPGTGNLPSSFRNKGTQLERSFSPFQRVSQTPPELSKTQSIERRIAGLTGNRTEMKASKTELDKLWQPQISKLKFRHRLEIEEKKGMKGGVSATASPHIGAASATVQQKSQLSGKIPSPLQLEKKAGKELLSHMAGKAVREGDFSRPRRQKVRKIPGHSAKKSLPVSRNVETRKEWMCNLALRAGDSLHHTGPDGLYAPIGETSASPEKNSLAWQWELSLDGQKASAVLLAYLASLPEKKLDEFDPRNRFDSRSEAPAVPRRHSERDAAAGTSESHPIDTSLEAQPEFAAGGGTHAFIRPPETGLQHLQDNWPEISTQHSSPFITGHNEIHPEAADQVPNTDHELKAPNIISSLVETHSVPTFLPLKREDVLSILFEEKKSRCNPPQDSATGNEDDLNTLAVKIKRILDEEARRHGIDV